MIYFSFHQITSQCKSFIESSRFTKCFNWKLKFRSSFFSFFFSSLFFKLSSITSILRVIQREMKCFIVLNHEKTSSFLKSKHSSKYCFIWEFVSCLASLTIEITISSVSYMLSSSIAWVINDESKSNEIWKLSISSRTKKWILEILIDERNWNHWERNFA
jgi:hypothetical protein